MTAPRTRTFLQNVLTVAGGTAIAQALPLLAAPLLTRLYAPSDVGGFGLLLAVTSVLAVPVTLRYSKAIVVPENPHEARLLLGLSVRLAFWLGLVLGAAATIVGWAFGFGLDGNGPAHWLLLPLATVLTGIQDSGASWLVRERRFRRLASTRVAQWVVVVLLQLSLPFFIDASPTILMGSFVMGQAIGVLALGLPALGFEPVPWASLRAVAMRHRAFPKFALPGDSLNILAGQAPILLLATFFGPIVTGLYSLTSRVLAAPSTLIAAATSDVFRERAARDYGATGTCRPLYLRTLATLLAVGLLPATILLGWAPEIFAWTFGDQWRQAGEFARLLTPFFLLRFAISPVSYVMYITNRQELNLWWQAALLLVVASALVVGGAARDPVVAVALFSTGYSVMYLVHAAIAYRVSGAPGRKGVQFGI